MAPNELLSPSNFLHRPKSDIKTLGRFVEESCGSGLGWLTRILWGFKSLCTIFNEWRWRTPEAIWRRTSMGSMSPRRSECFTGSEYMSNSDAGQSSNAMYKKRGPCWVQ